MSLIKRLNELIPPPDFPVETPGAEGWEPVVHSLGFAPPDDYREFIESYGSGSIADFLWVLNPFSLNPNLNLIQRGRRVLDSLRDISPEDDGVPYPIHPSSNGIYPWAITDNGDAMYWVIHRRAASSNIVISDPKCNAWRIMANSSIGTIADFLTNQSVARFFLNDPLEARPCFRPLQGGTRSADSFE